MKLAFSTNAYLRYPFEDAARRISEIGYHGIEVMADVPHAWPAHLLERDKAAIRQAVDRRGLKISNINAFMMNAVGDSRQPYWHPSWIESDRHYRQVRVDHTVRSLKLARELGAPSITTEPGGPLERGQPWSSALELFVQELKPAIEVAERLDVWLLVEPEPGLLIENSEQFLELMSHIDSPRFGLNFDIGHFYCVKEDPAQAIRRLSTLIRHVHVEDIASSREHHHLVPGDGAIDFAPVFQAMRYISYQGWLTVELYPFVDNPDEAARLAYDRLLPLVNAAPGPTGRQNRQSLT
jgi:sugar phosphate isomerase/epimerase